MKRNKKLYLCSPVEQLAKAERTRSCAVMVFHFRAATTEYFIVNCVGAAGAEEKCSLSISFAFLQTKNMSDGAKTYDPWCFCKIGQEEESFQKWQRFLRRCYASCLEYCKHLHDVASPGHRDKRILQNSWDEIGPCETDRTLREPFVLLNIHANVEHVWASISFYQTYLFLVCE